MFILALVPDLSSAPTHASVSAQELAVTGGYQGYETDIAAITINRIRCQNYLSGVIDVFRCKYADLRVRCLPELFTLNILSADVVEAGRSFSSPESVAGAVLVDVVMHNKYGCPTLFGIEG